MKMADTPDVIVVPPGAHDTTEQMEAFLKLNGDNSVKPRAMQDALDAVKANLDQRKAETAQ